MSQNFHCNKEYILLYDIGKCKRTVWGPYTSTTRLTPLECGRETASSAIVFRQVSEGSGGSFPSSTNLICSSPLDSLLSFPKAGNGLVTLWGWIMVTIYSRMAHLLVPIDCTIKTFAPCANASRAYFTLGDKTLSTRSAPATTEYASNALTEQIIN
ncbi:hypothetical protein EVAR_91946_1 [Eumeta japonica]|uniref:Uncharacterized protein n=1 Tax=Eumeta variegata TaxID=151549 RepID=A0A4C1S971_EUMVA|nr:hypothetical protein EVAR_91946_1 [Eumeta japonica]